ERAEWEGRHSRTCEARRDADPFERIAVLAMRALRAWQVREHEAARHRTRRVVCAAQEQPMQALRAGTGRVARDPGSRARQTVPTFPSGFGGVPLAYRGPPRVPMSLSRSTIRTELASTLRHLSDTSRRSAVRLIVAEKGTLGQDDILPEPGKGLELVLVAQGANEPASELLARTERRPAALERGDRGVADAASLVRASADPATRPARRPGARAVTVPLARSGSKAATGRARGPRRGPRRGPGAQGPPRAPGEQGAEGGRARAHATAAVRRAAHPRRNAARGVEGRARGHACELQRRGARGPERHFPGPRRRG